MIADVHEHAEIAKDKRTGEGGHYVFVFVCKKKYRAITCDF
jgi:hypothetical protein